MSQSIQEKDDQIKKVCLLFLDKKYTFENFKKQYFSLNRYFLKRFLDSKESNLYIFSI